MNLMVEKILNYFKKRPGWVVLIIILSCITAVNIKPNFYLMGWDNYSSYFNLKTNIFRTFFATWREYRGLGVPSDAEVTDIFRQIFYWLIHFIFPEQLLEQIYYLFSLWLGILAMYFFVDLIFENFYINKEVKTKKWQDLFATIAAFFYLFNLNTLSIFYSPIVPFINRFYSLPLTLFLIAKFIKSKTKKNLILLILTIVFTSGSYITPTVFITSFFAFFIYFLSNFNIKKTLIYSIVFILLNAFWLLPFVNYTFQKASIIPLTRTFIEINESTLNKPKTNFSLAKQSFFYPSFFDIQFPSLNGKSQPTHPLYLDYQKPLIKDILLFLPVFYALGSLLLLVFYKKNKKLLWIPAWILLFLFLSCKEYSPLGFLYTLLEKYIPYFNVVFRIGDTKFHSYINLAGSIAGAYAVIYILSFFRQKKILVLFFTIITISYLWLFRSYFSGDFINFLVYTKIPNVYFQIAKKINQDPDKIKVLHLPYDSWHHYWRSYSWGYVGSAFFNYFLNKPYIDKTFEPGSMENSYLDSKINLILNSFYRSDDELQRQQLAKDFLTLLQKTGIKYVLVDKSISSEVYPKNLIYSTKQSLVQSNAMLSYLYQNNLVSNVTEYNISLTDLYPYYKKLYPVKINGFPDSLPTETSIDLYEIDNTQPSISFISSASNLNPNLDNMLETNIDTLVNNNIVQNDKQPAQFFPFLQQNHQAKVDSIGVTLKYPSSLNSNSNYIVSTKSTDIDSYMIDVYGKINEDNLSLSFFHRYYPDINDQKFQQYVDSVEIPISDFDSSTSFANLMNDWSVDNSSQILEHYRLKLNDIFMPIPSTISTENSYIGSYILHEKSIKASLLTENNIIKVDTDSFSQLGSNDKPVFEQIPIVFNDKNLDNQYIEIGLTIHGSAKDNQNNNSPIHGYVCVRQSNLNDCLNSHRNLQVFNDKTDYRIPLQDYVSSQVPFLIEIGSLPFDGENQKLTIEGIDEYLYSSSREFYLAFVPYSGQQSVIINGPLTVSFPYTISKFSYYHKPQFELFDTTQEPCRSNNLRKVNFSNGVLINNMQDCSVAFAQFFQYAYQEPYLITFDYWLGSGQQPVLNIAKKNDAYLTERVSLYQGYPNLSENKQSKNIHLINASRLMAPQFISNTYSAKVSVSISQDTANEGLLALGSFNIIDYPADWQNLSIKPLESDSYYDLPDSFDYKQILPSLWFVNYKSKGSFLMLFNEGYDKQWGIYDNIFDLIIGKKIGESIRCDGYANCFQVNTNSNSNQFFIFYWPERLYLFGWLLTILTMIFSLKFLSKDPLKTE